MEHPKSIVRDLTTKDSDEYIFFPVTTGSVHFQVKAPNDACVLLSKTPDSEADTHVEFNIGSWRNKKIGIRNFTEKLQYLNHKYPDILSKDEFRGFWISWCGGIMHFGLEGQNFPICNIEHPKPFPVFFVGVSTAWGATGTWKIEGMPEFKTPNKRAYHKFYPVVAGSVEFEFRGARSCQIALTPKPTVTDAMCEVILNSEENAESYIKYSTKSGNYMMLCQVKRKTPKIFGGECFQPFVIKWRKGLTKVCNSWYTENDSNPTIMEMESLSPPSFNITHFGVRTTNGASGSWRISTIETQMA